MMDGKTAIVFGASAGIGRAYALALAQAGASVVAAARTLGAPDGSERNSLHNTVKLAEGLPGAIHPVPCDVEEEADIARTIDETVQRFGRIDVLINNAVYMPQCNSLEIPADMWDAMMRINVRAPYLAIREAAPHMQHQGSGSVINVSAKAGDLNAWKHTTGLKILAYATTKSALNRLTVYLAEELRADGIAVNALSPGVVATDTALAATPNLVELGGKPPTPEVLGPAMLHLAMQGPGGITGQILYTDDFGKSWP